MSGQTVGVFTWQMQVSATEFNLPCLECYKRNWLFSDCM